MIRKFTQAHAPQILITVGAIAITLMLSSQMTAEDRKAMSWLHQSQSDRIKALEADVARLSQKLIDGAIIVIDCEEQKTGRKTK